MREMILAGRQYASLIYLAVSLGLLYLYAPDQGFLSVYTYHPNVWRAYRDLHSVLQFNIAVFTIYITIKLLSYSEGRVGRDVRYYWTYNTYSEEAALDVEKENKQKREELMSSLSGRTGIKAGAVTPPS
jgi:hypothetical protein